MANDGSYAEYENNGNYDEGLDDSYDAFHDDITAAYFECMSPGLDGSADHIIQIIDGKTSLWGELIKG